MSFNPVAKFSVLKSHKFAALGIVFGFALAAYSCAGREAATNDTTADTPELFAPVFLANLESALTVAKVPAGTVVKIMSEVISPALGLASSSEASSQISQIFVTAVAAVSSNVSILTTQTVTTFVTLVAQYAANATGTVSVLASALSTLGVSPTPPGADSPEFLAAAAIVIGNYVTGTGGGE